MIRDSDGKNPKYLKKQLCSYYSQRAKEDVGNLPRVEPKNVLILKYYSFENYFLDPKIMARIGVIKSEEDFYNKQYGSLFKAMIELYNEGKTCDLVTVKSKLEETGVPSEVVSLDFIRNIFIG